MSNTVTAQNLRIAEEAYLPASGTWNLGSVSDLPRIFARLEKPNIYAAGIAFLLAASSFSFATNPWIIERRRQITTTLPSVYQLVSARRISTSEARQIALTILVQAEAERVHVAEEEARRGVKWEDVP